MHAPCMREGNENCSGNDMSQRSFASAEAGALLHGDETAAHGDAGCRGVHKRKEAQGPHWHVAMQPGKRRQLDLTRKWAQLTERAEQLRASIRAKVEHPFHVIKNLFRHRRVRYKGLAKNEAQLFSLFGLANLQIAKRSLLILQPEVRLERQERPQKGRKALGKAVAQAAQRATDRPRVDFAPHVAQHALQRSLISISLVLLCQ